MPRQHIWSMGTNDRPVYRSANDAEHKNCHKEREITEDRREQETLQKGLKYREMEEVRRRE